jgi:hypothetical protein
VKGDGSHDDEEGRKICLFIYSSEATVLCEFVPLLTKPSLSASSRIKSKGSLVRNRMRN